MNFGGSKKFKNATGEQKMKKIGLINLMLVIGLVVAGYSKAQAEDSPSDVVKKWYKALEKGDKKTFCDLTTNPEKALGMFADMERQLKEHKKRKTSGMPMTIYEAKIYDGITYVGVSGFAGQENYGEWSLVKIDGKWKIDLSKYYSKYANWFIDKKLQHSGN